MPLTQTGSFGQVKLPESETPQKVKFWLFETPKLKVKFLDFGCIIQSLECLDKDNNFDDIALGFETAQEYIENHMYYGTVVGRVGNRIMDGKFELNDQVYQLEKNNNGLAHLHGGTVGWGRKIWNFIENTDNSITFEYVSADGEHGYPAQVTTRVTYSIENDNQLRIIYKAKNDDSEKSTLINLTNHSYFNLSGHKNFDGNLDSHKVVSSAEFYTPLNHAMCPTGEIRSVKENPAFDLTGEGVILTKENLEKPGNGYDHNFCFAQPGQMKFMFEFSHLKNGRKMKVESDVVGAQFYSTNFFKGHIGKKGIVHERQSGFACETQDYPDSVNHQGKFPTSTVYGPGEEYSHQVVFSFDN